MSPQFNTARGLVALLGLDDYLTPYAMGVLSEAFDAEATPRVFLLGGSIGWGRTTVTAIMALGTALRFLDPPAGQEPQLMPDAGVYAALPRDVLGTAEGLVRKALRLLGDAGVRVESRMSGFALARGPWTVSFVEAGGDWDGMGRDLLVYVAGGAVNDPLVWHDHRNRILSRFHPAHGLAVALGEAPAYEGILRRERDSGQLEAGNVVVREPMRWETQPAHIFTQPPFRVLLPSRYQRGRILGEAEEVPAGRTAIAVPGEYRQEFERSLGQALRDLAGPGAGQP